MSVGDKLIPSANQKHRLSVLVFYYHRKEGFIQIDVFRFIHAFVVENLPFLNCKHAIIVRAVHVISSCITYCCRGN